MSGSQSPNRTDEVMSENSQNRQSEPTREATPQFYDQDDGIIRNFNGHKKKRTTFRLRGMEKDWWLRASEARTLKNQPWTWNDFQEEFKKEYIP
ncbi:hypothetical protein M9H77_27001 [Catharanthus roseus]|uniref:Uncharacterized protein n=1 Tax=Catharanthus roseus TaxID=4058 RepID=A0ACC0AFH8_CATRO|nr:hypothetical protein M9H77_27001 [Catharanthus roseus]